MRRTFSLMMVGILLLVACNSDNEQDSSLNMIVDGSWRLSGILVNMPDTNTGYSEVNIFDLPECPECIKDDNIEISSNGYYNISLGHMRCNNDMKIFKFPHEGTWIFTNHEQSIILNHDRADSIHMDIDNLTNAELRLTFYDTIPQSLVPNDTSAQAITILYLH